MGRIIDYLVCGFVVIVVLSFLINHGAIDFRGVDFIANKTKEAIESEEGKEIANELKGIAKDTASTIVTETGKRIKVIKKNAKESAAEAEAEETEESGKEVTLVAAALIRVVDGDTLVVDAGDGEEKIRLIGVDTPESVNPDESKNTDFGDKASEYTKSILAGVKTVYLQYDISKEDSYGRTLAYVWLDAVGDVSSARNVSNYMLNGMLVADGYAIDAMYRPNIEYADAFAVLREEAQSDKRGLWSEEGIGEIWGD